MDGMDQKDNSSYSSRQEGQVNSENIEKNLEDIVGD